MTWDDALRASKLLGCSEPIRVHFVWQPTNNHTNVVDVGFLSPEMLLQWVRKNH